VDTPWSARSLVGPSIGRAVASPGNLGGLGLGFGGGLTGLFLELGEEFLGGLNFILDGGDIDAIGGVFVFECFLPELDGFIFLAELAVGVADMVADFRIVGSIVLEGLEEVFEGFVEIASAIVIPAETVEVGGIFRIILESLANEVAGFLEVFVSIDPHVAEVIEGLVEGGVERDGALEAVGGAFVLFGAFSGCAVLEIEVGGLGGAWFLFEERIGGFEGMESGFVLLIGQEGDGIHDMEAQGEFEPADAFGEEFDGFGCVESFGGICGVVGEIDFGEAFVAVDLVGVEQEALFVGHCGAAEVALVFVELTEQRVACLEEGVDADDGIELLDGLVGLFEVEIGLGEFFAGGELVFVDFEGGEEVFDGFIELTDPGMEIADGGEDDRIVGGVYGGFFEEGLDSGDLVGGRIGTGERDLEFTEPDAEGEPEFRGLGFDIGGLLEDTFGGVTVTLGFVGFVEPLVDGEIAGLNGEGLVGVLGGEVGFVEVATVEEGERDERSGIVGGGCCAIFQDGDGFGDIVAADIFEGDFFGETVMSGVEVEAFAVGLEGTFEFPLLFQDFTDDEPSDCVGLAGGFGGEGLIRLRGWKGQGKDIGVIERRVGGGAGHRGGGGCR